MRASRLNMATTVYTGGPSPFKLHTPSGYKEDTKPSVYRNKIQTWMACHLLIAFEGVSPTEREVLQAVSWLFGVCGSPNNAGGHMYNVLDLAPG